MYISVHALHMYIYIHTHVHLQASTRKDFLQDLGGSGCTSSSKCGQCQGDCDADADCDAGLYCFQRDLSSQVVPGCLAGGTGDVGDRDYCTEAVLGSLQSLDGFGCTSL